MPSLSQITIAGHLGRDAELKTTPSGQSVCSFNLAVTTKKSGGESTAWYACTLWGKRGEGIAPHLTKGTALIVCGQLVPREYEGKQGDKRMSLDVNVSELTFAGGGGEARSGSGSASGSRSSAPANDYDSDVSF